MILTNRDSVLLESALMTLRMIASANVFKDESGDKVILSNYKDMAEKEVELIKQAQLEDLRQQAFGERDPDTDFEEQTRYHECD